MSIRSGLRLSRDAARWGARFYLRRFVIVFGLSTVPTVQRFVAVRWGQDLPTSVNVTAEIVTAASRLLLLYVIVKLAFGGDPEVGRLTRETRWERLGRFIDHRRSDFAVQFLVLGAAFVVCDVLPTMAIEQWVTGDVREWVTATLVAVKNPTVIAFTMIWMTAVARQMIVSETPQAAMPGDA
ncbi:hypothetical protein GCM10022226_68120 [Sphaerisporangium flaviroseum]|uniref:Uncharacterized protein n=1 Tax=Sphaerisporangium flaviroseum TaxID=509199 RepID=A0ABP7J8L1_9ACTN